MIDGVCWNSNNISNTFQAMNNLLNNPAIQSGILPFIVAIFVALLFTRLARQWTGLSFAVAYFLSVYLAVGFQLLPLTSTRKILILGIFAIVLGILFDRTKFSIKNLAAIVFTLGAATCLWVIWPSVARSEGMSAILLAIPALFYTGWICWGSYQLRNKTDQSAMAAMALGFGTGISAILGASALVGQLGMAIGAIAGAYLLLLLFRQNLTLGSTFSLPAGLLSGLLGISVVYYASLPWYCLIPLAAIPLTVYIQVPNNLTRLKTLFIIAAFTLPFPVIAVTLAWFSTSSGESMY